MNAIGKLLVAGPLLFAVPTQAAVDDLTIQAPVAKILDVTADETYADETYVDGEALVHVTTDGHGGAAVSGAMGSDIADGYCE